MKIMALSDFHGATHVLAPLKEKIEHVNPSILTFSGDIVKGYSRGDEWLAARDENRDPQITEAIKKEEQEDLQFYNTFFTFLDQLSIPVFMVPGNMDAPESRFLNSAPHQYVVHNSLKRTPVVITGFGGEITEDKKEDFFVLQYPRKTVMDAIKPFSDQKVTIVITHSPPVSSLSFEEGQEKGSMVVNDLIDLLHPDYLFCGHAHKTQGAEQIKSTFVVNPGALKYGNYSIIEGDLVEFGQLGSL